MMRRGQAEMLDWFVRLMVMTVAVVIVVMLVRIYADRHVEADQTQRAAYLYRIYYDDIIMHSDQSSRVYPGVVDMHLATSERLDAVFIGGKMASEIVLSPQPGCSIAARTIYNDKTTYDQYRPWATSLKGSGGATMENRIFPVVLKDAGLRCAGTMDITIVRPNS
jgi:hypothetical protein